MSWAANYAGCCPTCDGIFLAGAEVEFSLDGLVQHKGCAPDLGNVDRRDTVTWSVSGESLDRAALIRQEEARYAPQVRPACPSCFLELPASKVCGQCQ